MLSRDELLIPATRYYMGRMTIAAATHAESLAREWSSLPLNVRMVIRRDLEAEFSLEDRIPGRLGMRIDRDMWEKLREVYSADAESAQ